MQSPFEATSTDQLDVQFGFLANEIERSLLGRARAANPEGDMDSWGRGLHDGSQTWIGLAPEVLQTPYDELDRMCQNLDLSEDAHVVDLGAAYGRMAFVLHHHRPLAHFTGIEFVPERVDEGNRVFERHNLNRARLIQDDLSREDFLVPLADVYFVYDYGNVEHIRHTLEQLKFLAGTERFQVVARGKGVRSLIQYSHPWLSQMGTPYHEENFSVYRNYEQD
mgnify:FL=1